MALCPAPHDYQVAASCAFRRALYVLYTSPDFSKQVSVHVSCYVRKWHRWNPTYSDPAKDVIWGRFRD